MNKLFLRPVRHRLRTLYFSKLLRRFCKSEHKTKTWREKKIQTPDKTGSILSPFWHTSQWRWLSVALPVCPILSDTLTDVCLLPHCSTNTGAMSIQGGESATVVNLNVIPIAASVGLNFLGGPFCAFFDFFLPVPIFPGRLFHGLLHIDSILIRGLCREEDAISRPGYQDDQTNSRPPALRTAARLCKAAIGGPECKKILASNYYDSYNNVYKI